MFKSVLSTNLDRSRLLHIGHACLRFFMERDKVYIYKNAKRTGPISAADPGKGPGKGPGRPAPSPPPPLCLEKNEARTAGKYVFGDRLHLSQSLDAQNFLHQLGHKQRVCLIIGGADKL